MSVVRILANTVLALLPGIALAQQPYAVLGLHVDLEFAEAVAQAESLGGDCSINPPGTADSDRVAQCEYLPCAAIGASGVCDGREEETPGPLIAAQPVVHISLEAPGDAATLTRIAIVFEGSVPVVAEELINRYGQPDSGAKPPSEGSWSHAHRRSWKRGNYLMGLLNSPQLIILGVEIAPPSP